MEVVLQSEAMLMPGVEIKKKFADYANNLFSEIIYGVCGKKCGIYMGRN